jgi:hypothetical protein
VTAAPDSWQVPNHARLVVRKGPLVGAVLSRVVGMLAARALCPIDRLDDALLVTDAIAAHAGDFTADGTVGVTVIVAADADAITMIVAPLRAQGADGLLRAAELPGVGNVLERVADEVTTGQAEDETGEELRVRVAFHPG